MISPRRRRWPKWVSRCSPSSSTCRPTSRRFSPRPPPTQKPRSRNRPQAAGPDAAPAPLDLGEETMEHHNRIWRAALLATPLAVFVAFVIAPLLTSFYYSVTNWNGYSSNYAFVGLANFARIGADRLFMQAAVNTAIWIPAAIVLPTALGLALALLLDSKVAGSRIFQEHLLSADLPLGGDRRPDLDLDLPAGLGPAQRIPVPRLRSSGSLCVARQARQRAVVGHCRVVLAADRAVDGDLSRRPDVHSRRSARSLRDRGRVALAAHPPRRAPAADAREAQGHARTVARPNIPVSDGKNAVIKSGSGPNVQTSSPQWGTNAELVEVCLKLQVTPKILSDGRIKMMIVVTDNEPNIMPTTGELYLEREAHTTMIVSDRETRGIGGIIRDTAMGRREGWPGFMNLLIVGMLFSNKTKAKEIDELLVFISPKVVFNPN